MNKQHLRLTDDDRRELEMLLSKSSLKALTFKRTTALLLLDRGKTFVEVATTLGVTSRVVATWRTRYITTRLACLYDAPRSGRPTVFGGLQRAKITALATSDTPKATPAGATVCSQKRRWKVASVTMSPIPLLLMC